ncbi:MAG TPA: 16S rRNA (cytidine(1402)-2'-O)-methyltransferase [Abditibacteriaceae bacterium]|jgi:16S rRNA (cytidine1402-2'-O)-methyltransferase
MPGSLFVCATPIGHLEDVSLRLLATLREADAVLAEDTRQTQKLLARHEITVPLISCHEHTHPAKIDALAERLAAGETFALVTDSGTPGISDPGPPLVVAAVALGVPVLPIPGPCALAAALSISGFDAQRFSFLGFLPRKPGKRRKALVEAVSRGETLVIYESPHRIVATLKDVATTSPTANVAACRELTKKFEETRRGPASEVAAYFAAQKEVRGEFVLVVEGVKDAQAVAADEEDDSDD